MLTMMNVMSGYGCQVSAALQQWKAQQTWSTEQLLTAVSEEVALTSSSSRVLLHCHGSVLHLSPMSCQNDGLWFYACTREITLCHTTNIHRVISTVVAAATTTFAFV